MTNDLTNLTDEALTAFGEEFGRVLARWPFCARRTRRCALPSCACTN